jgi:hypothetical protein
VAPNSGKVRPPVKKPLPARYLASLANDPGSSVLSPDDLIRAARSIMDWAAEKRPGRAEVVAYAEYKSPITLDRFRNSRMINSCGCFCLLGVCGNRFITVQNQQAAKSIILHKLLIISNLQSLKSLFPTDSVENRQFSSLWVGRRPMRNS